MKKLTIKALKKLFNDNYFLRDYLLLKKEQHEQYIRFYIFYTNKIIDIDVFDNWCIGACNGYITTIQAQQLSNIVVSIETMYKGDNR